MRAIIVGFVFAVMQVLPGAFAQQSKPAQNAADQIPLTLTISGPQTVTVGDTIIFHEVLTNVSNHPIAISLGMQYTILIREENGKEVSHKSGNWAFIGNSYPGLIEPGKTISDHPTALGDEYELKPGRYVVRYQRSIDDDDPKSPILQSNEITITVLSKKPDAAQEPKPAQSVAEQIPLTFTIIGPQTVSAGDKIIIHVLQKNVSNHPIQIVVWWAYDVIIHDERGKEPRKLGLSGGSSVDGYLEPGETFPEDRILSSQYDLSVPGKYVVQLQRHLDYADSKSPIVKSNEITITVLPK
jgi:hypothetical protein